MWHASNSGRHIVTGSQELYDIRKKGFRFPSPGPMHTCPEVGPALHQEAALTGHCLVISSKKARPWQLREIRSYSEMDLGLPGTVRHHTPASAESLITGLSPGAQQANRLTSQPPSQPVGLGEGMEGEPHGR